MFVIKMQYGTKSGLWLKNIAYCILYYLCYKGEIYFCLTDSSTTMRLPRQVETDESAPDEVGKRQSLNF